MEANLAIKDELDLRTSAMAFSGLLNVMFAAIAIPKIRTQRRMLTLGNAKGQETKPSQLR